MKRGLLYLLTALLCVFCTTAHDDRTYDGQLSNLQTQYKRINIQAPRFFLFGMGNREKYLYKDYKLINIRNDSVVFTAKKPLHDSIMPSEYSVLIETSEGQIEIKEDEEGIWLNRGGVTHLPPGRNCYLKLPSFDNFKYRKVLRVLHQELLFNILDSRIYPNILVYKALFYRDAFMTALCLEKNGNIHLIRRRLYEEKNVYNMQNGESEVDNLGEMLYMLSFIPSDSNKILRDALIIEIEKQTSCHGSLQYLQGHTDGAENAEYQTQILKYALQKNNLSKGYTNVLNDAVGDYFDLCWFTKGCHHSRKIDRWFKDLRFNYKDPPFPYLQWARTHYYNNTNAAFNCQQYPLSWEKRGGAHFEGMNIISENAVKEHICYPHV